jgi:pyridoxamine 5'-phosphate oxidase
LDERDPDPDPLALLTAWLAEAAASDLVHPDAMTLATVDSGGRPSARMVLLRGVDARGLVFYTNRESAKAGDLARNPRAALVLYWQPLERQVRVEGAVELVGDADSAAYFATRPRGSQVAAWASPQSQPLVGRDVLERRYAEVEARFANGDVPLPPFWGGYRVVPDGVEFWQARPNRLHDRDRYDRRDDGTWVRSLLSP